MAKAQVVSTDFRGRHNSDLGKSIARVKQGGSWKKQRTIVVLPSADLIPAKVALSHWSLVFPQVPIPDTIQECCGLSMGFTLWRLKTFKDDRLKKPWFRTIAGKEGVGTQDLQFWTDARKYGYRCAVDTRVLVGHYDYDGKFGAADTVW